MLPFAKILLIISTLACGPGQVKQQSRYLEVLGATSQEWVAGVRGGGRGVNYRLRIKIRTNNLITFDSIWLAGKRLPVKLEPAGKASDLKAAKNDVVTLLASDFTGRPGRMGSRTEDSTPIPPAASVKAPIAYEGAALVKYSVGGSVQYLPVPGITVLPAIYGQ
jgi:hypothetical protein